jgi:hypothetical protein
MRLKPKCPEERDRRSRYAYRLNRCQDIKESHERTT